MSKVADSFPKPFDMLFAAARGVTGSAVFLQLGQTTKIPSKTKSYPRKSTGNLIRDISSHEDPSNRKAYFVFLNPSSTVHGPR